MRIRYLMPTFIGLLLTGLASAAPPHSVTYERKSVSPGTTLDISGVEFTVVRIPVRDFSGNNYGITVPVRSDSGVLGLGIVSTTHSTDPIGANMQIDGFDALVTVTDGRTYVLTEDFFTNPGTNVFTAQGHATAIVRIQVGSMVVDLSQIINSKDPLTGESPETNVNIGASYNAMGFAEYSEWTDPVKLVNALGLWIDYIRIGPQ